MAILELTKLWNDHINQITNKAISIKKPYFKEIWNPLHIQQKALLFVLYMVICLNIVRYSHPCTHYINHHASSNMCKEWQYWHTIYIVQGECLYSHKDTLIDSCFTEIYVHPDQTRIFTLLLGVAHCMLILSLKYWHSIYKKILQGSIFKAIIFARNRLMIIHHIITPSTMWCAHHEIIYSHLP